MKKFGGIFWGLVLVIIGVILGGNATGLFDVDVFFDGWWTLFIIVPSIFGLLSDKDKTGSLIFLIVGVSLLLACQNIIDFSLIMKLIVPAIIVVIGLSIIFKNAFNGEIDAQIAKVSKKLDEKEGIFAAFSGQDIKVDKEKFEGTQINAIFGGVKLDLRNAIIKDDVVINASAVFGGINIITSDDVIVKIKSNSIFGGVDNKKTNKENAKSKVIYINATCIFGGVEVR